MAHRLCGVLSTWMQNYPGDFTAPSTFGILQPFLESLLPRGATWVAHYALELVPLLAPISVLSDPESSWALPDKPLEGAIPAVEGVFDASSRQPQQDGLPPRPPMSPRRPSLARSYDSSSSLAVSSQPLSKSVSRLSAHESIHSLETTPSLTGGPFGLSPSISQHSRSPRPASEAGTVDTQDSLDGFSGSAGGVGNGNGSIGGASTTPSGLSSGAVGRRIGGGKESQVMVEVSNVVMEMREEEIATQITRIAWEMFGGMSVRLSSSLSLFPSFLVVVVEEELTEVSFFRTASRPHAPCSRSEGPSEPSSCSSRLGEQRYAFHCVRQRAFFTTFSFLSLD